MPSITVFITHYGEQIILSLREVIKGKGKHFHVTMLLYLKQWYSLERCNFVNDSKIMAKEFEPTSAERDCYKDEFS